MMAPYEVTGVKERILLNRKRHLLVLMEGTRRTLVFDSEGRVLYIARDGEMLRRGLDNSLLLLDGPSRRIPPSASRSLLADVYRHVESLSEHGPPGLREALRPALTAGIDRLARDAEKFAKTYGRVPALPPDQYDCVYVQAVTGCPYGRCSFCTLYRGRPFHVRAVEEFHRHLDDVRELLGVDAGRRRSIFLGDAAALCAPTEDLVALGVLARFAFPNREMHAFADATFHVGKTVDELRELARLGLRRVTLGLETGNEKLYRELRKPGTVVGAYEGLRMLKDAGLNVGVTVLVGAGGWEYFDRHLEDTIELLRPLELGLGDFVYLCPLVVQPETAYEAWASVGPGRSLSREELRLQLDMFRRMLRKHLYPGGVRVATYDITRFVY